MRNLFLSILAFAALPGLAAAAPGAPAVLPPAVSAAALPQAALPPAVQMVQYYGGGPGWREREEWRRRREFEWHRREEWRRRQAAREYYRGAYGYGPRW